MGNVGIYSVGAESMYQIVQSGRTKCLKDVSREGLTREILDSLKGCGKCLGYQPLNGMEMER